MKKLILLSALVCLASSASALTFKWQESSATPNLNSTGGNLDGFVYIVCALSTPDLGTPVWNSETQSFGAGFEIYGASAVADGTFSAVSQTTSGNWGESTMPVANSGLLPTGSPNTVTTPNNGVAFNRDYYLVFFDGTLSAGNYAVIAHPTVAVSGTAPSTDTLGTYTLTFVGRTTGGEGSGWEPVPEPTSLALLAVGLAAVGLRRKFRK